MYERVPREDIETFIKDYDEAYDGRLSGYHAFCRVVSLTWFNKKVTELNLQDQELVGVVSGYADEPELKLLRPREVILYDYDIDKRFDIDLDWSHMPSPGFSFTLCNQVLEHVFNPHLAFKNLLHCTRPGGYIFISCPVINCIHGEPNFYSSGYHPRFLERLAKESGIDIVGIGVWGTARWLVNAVSGVWLNYNTLAFGYHEVTDLRFPNFVFSDGRDEDCDMARRMGFENVMTDCWGLFRKRD